MLLSFTFAILFLDLSQVHTLIKIPLRALSIIIMILPIWVVIRKDLNIQTILFKQKLNKKKFIKLFFVILISFIFLVRFITYRQEFFSFSKSLHYDNYLWIYLSFGYLSQVFLQDILLILLYNGMITFVSGEKRSIFIITLLFGFAHFSLSIFAAVITFLIGVIFLLVYKKFENIFALNIIHYPLGIISIAFGWT
jgi:hypothetical protein